MLIRPLLAQDMAVIFAIRTAVRENAMNLDELAELDITPERLAERVTRGETPGWCALENGTVIGFSMVQLAQRVVFALFVAPGHEGKGAGSALLRAAEQALAASGTGPMQLSTDRGSRAHGLYLRRGWEDVSPEPASTLAQLRKLPE